MTMDNQVDKTKLQPGEALSIARILSGDYTEAIEALPELAPFLSSLGAPPPATSDAPAPAANQAKLQDEQARRKNNLATLPLQLAKQLERIHERHEERFHGPQGESRSQSIADWTHPIPIEEIVCETDFSNIRLKPADSEIDFLADSMSEEGLKVPITVSEGQDGKFLLRAGFRRVAAARKLAWTYIPAIVLPKDTPKISEHWTNIIENTARTSLRTYEIANAAHIMKKNFNVDPKTFARKAGYDPIYITRMVKAIENLPQTILEHWRDVGKFPIDWYCNWSNMHHAEALNSFHLEVGQRFHHRTDPMLPADHPRPKKRDKVQTATNSGLKRMQRLRFAVLAYTKPMDDATRRSYLEIIDYCMGIRDTVLDIYDCNARHQSSRGRKNEKELSMEEEMQKMIAEVCTGEEDGKPIVSDVLPIRVPPTSRHPREPKK
jgi:ParB/RepB/Spo0J family partition protein